MSEPPRRQDLREWPKAVPIVFRKPPAEYEIVAPERFAEWEALLLKSVNLKIKAPLKGAGWLPTISWCGQGETDACDCDHIADQ